jgi:hypothetical protein
MLGSAIIGTSSSKSASGRTRDHINTYHQADNELKRKRQKAVGLFDKGLNEQQHAAVRLCTEPGGSPVALIHGPFGTGKTRTLVIFFVMYLIIVFNHIF